MKKHNIALFAILCSLLLITIDWCQWDIIVRITKRYNSLISGFFFYFICFVRISMLFLLIILIIKLVKQVGRRNKTASILALIIALFTLALLSFIPFTDTFSDLEYLYNYNKREKIVSMLNGNEEMKLVQINTDSYILPQSLRTASHNAKIITERNNDSLKILFFIHKGVFKNSAIVYTSDDKINNAEFGMEFEKVKSLNDCWYFVVF